MKLEKLSQKPKIIKNTIDDEDIVKEFGEAIEFYTWDRIPIDQFIKLASVDQNNYHSVLDAVSELILNEEGKPIINKETSLPNKVLMRVVTKVVNNLGK